MKNLKKIMLCVLCFVVCFAMFGCSKLTYSVTVKQSGVIFASIKIEYDEDAASMHDLTNAKPIIREYYNQLNEAYVSNIVNLYQNVYEDIFEGKPEYDTEQEKFDYIYQKNLTKFLIGGDETLIHNGGRFITLDRQFGSIYGYLMYFYPKAFEYDAEKNEVVISKDYKSLIDVPMAGEVIRDEGMFITKVIQSFSPFSYNGEEPKFLKDDNSSGRNIQAGQTVAFVLADTTGRTEEEVRLMFNFTTPYKRVHSNGTVAKTSDGYTHSWVLGNLGATVNVWRSAANTAPWYAVAIIVVVGGIFVGTITIAIIRSVKKKKGLDALKKIEDLTRKQ